MNFYAAANQSYPGLSDDTKEAIDAFCAGVNAYLDTDPPLSVEFFLLGLKKPSPWYGRRSYATRLPLGN
jgi:penicillin amidase